jgi:hypothetical protein
VDEGSEMDDLRARAQLVGLDRAGTIGTVFARAEIAEAAAGTEFPATLLLDLDRVEPDGGDTRATVAVDWDQETLEQLLASTEDQEIELWFDERELSLAFDDVEGHGIREKAAVLAVGVVAAAAASSPAYARMASEPSGDGTVAPATSVAPNPAADKHAVLQGAERALQQDRQLSQNLGSGHAVAPATAVAPDPAGDKAAVMQGTERGLVQDRKLSQNLSSEQAAVTSAGGSTLSTGELAGAVAGGALLIAAAGFGATRKRTPPAQPA